MDVKNVKTHQQIEFFLLYSLVVDELRILKRTKRITPAKESYYSINQCSAIITRLLRSFLMKVFPAPMFTISKKNWRYEFEIKVVDNTVCSLLLRTKDILPTMYQLLQPGVDEIGLLYFDFPYRLTLRFGDRIRRNKWASHSTLQDIGIGRYCSVAKAALSWKKRFDNAIKEAMALEVKMGSPTPVVNRAQEQLDAVLRAATKAGRL